MLSKQSAISAMKYNIVARKKAQSSLISGLLKSSILMNSTSLLLCYFAEIKQFAGYATIWQNKDNFNGNYFRFIFLSSSSG